MAIGIVFLPAGGFLGVLGTSLIAQGILELVQIGISIDQGIPIDLEQFVKSKGIGIAVAIITAGIAQGLDKVMAPVTETLSTGEKVTMSWATKNVAGWKGLADTASVV